jgi:hypothetical protein
MHYCPECRSEYKDAVVRCADCGVDLVSTLPRADGAATDEPFVEIFATNNREDIETARQLLAGATIDFFVRPLRDAAFPTSIGIDGEQRVAVPESRKQEARILLLEATQDGAVSANGALLE